MFYCALAEINTQSERSGENNRNNPRRDLSRMMKQNKKMIEHFISFAEELHKA